VYNREIKSLGLIENSHNTTLTFLFGAVLTDVFLYGSVLTEIGAVFSENGAVLDWGHFRLGPFRLATIDLRLFDKTAWSSNYICFEQSNKCLLFITGLITSAIDHF